MYVLSVRDTTIGKSELSDEVMRTSLTRAKMCESIVQLRGQSAVACWLFHDWYVFINGRHNGSSLWIQLLKELPISDEISPGFNG